MPKISVIIPVYNGERFVAETIHGVLAQTYHDLELIVVDDGSTDRTGDIVTALLPASYHYQPNAGVGPARNTGFALASGEYVAFLDADDVWHPRMLEHTVAALDADPQLDVVYTDAALLDEKGQVTGGGTAPELTNLLPALLMSCFIISPGSVLLRRRVVEQVGGFRNLQIGEDWDFYLRLAVVEARFRHLPYPLQGYRLHGGNITAQRDWSTFVENMVLPDIYRLGLPLGVPPLGLAQAHRYMYAAYRTLGQGKFWPALRHVSGALLLHPLSVFTYFGRRALLRLLVGRRWANGLERWLRHRRYQGMDERVRQYWG
ncbi:MAG: glycosyltransferase [Deinococcus sp.]|nr:glycosyltransferase [Deinococcus sp.]